jgi:outer membrane protein assembly factor BamB
LYALDVETGKLVWSVPQDNTEQSTGTTPTIYNGIIYSSNNQGPATYLAKTGELLWKTPLKDHTGLDSAAVCLQSGIPVVAYVAFNGFSNSLVGLDTATGTLRWNVTDPDSNISNVGSSCMHNPQANGIVYLCGIHNLYAIECAEGKLYWKWASPYTGNDGGLSSPSITNGAVYVGCDDFSVKSINATTGSLLWSAPTGSYVWSDPVRSGDSVFVGSQDGYFYSFCA